jgi:purine-cytosine permease-like protein
MSIIALISRYASAIRREFTHFSRRNASLYVGVFLTAVSIAFLIDTDNILVLSLSSAITITGGIIILAYFFQRIRSTIKRRKNAHSEN